MSRFYPEHYIVCIGDHIYGPFKTAQAAFKWGESQFFGSRFSVRKLSPP